MPLDLTPLADLYNLQVGLYRNAVEFRFAVLPLASIEWSDLPMR